MHFEGMTQSVGDTVDTTSPKLLLDLPIYGVDLILLESGGLGRCLVKTLALTFILLNIAGLRLGSIICHGI